MKLSMNILLLTVVLIFAIITCLALYIASTSTSNFSWRNVFTVKLTEGVVISCENEVIKENEQKKLPGMAVPNNSK